MQKYKYIKKVLTTSTKCANILLYKEGRKMKLKKEVKRILLLSGALLILFLALKIEYDNAVSSCVNSGHSQEYCEKSAK